jgi:23S rRNA (uracil1939-C5)-methyltransferase
MLPVIIEKLVHGGQGLGTLPDGRKVFVWNALPGERVEVRLRKGKKRFAEGVAEEIIEASAERIKPHDEAYLSTSPWQIMTFAAENRYKQAILQETLSREHVAYSAEIPFHHGEAELAYRNKMEYSFWGDDDGLHLALFHRGSHGKRIITHSSIARPEVDETANKICTILDRHGIRGSQLKSVVVRCNQAGQCVAALFTKDENFPELTELSGVCLGVAVYFSNPKSPASVLTRQLYRYGDISLTDDILGAPLTYDVNSFFQVNVPVFEMALRRIKTYTEGMTPVTDFYSGVGTIGIPVGASVLVESDTHNVQMAHKNAADSHTQIVQATAESALELVSNHGVLIVDPPRAGLHSHLIARIREARPQRVIYLSCNPITQARDLALLQDSYDITSIEGYNFFPRTPHIESLAMLEARGTK